jgi:hypothetical protein
MPKRVPVTAPRSTPKIRAVWPNPAEPSATLVCETPTGQIRERQVGPRTILTLDEAAAVVKRSPEAVQQAIRAGFLRPVRGRDRRCVTMKACRDYVRELLADLAVARARAPEPGSPAEEVYRRLEI